ncbi:hypothetical protein [Novosphingobium nitrogenifigens]|uniref:hypothetical protein n=1 Tax=Novosphingobium nitrogenifigens TaxID=378548 RepID=UPI00037E93C6|nr:hypothetical protein [Novosphingobium nitrogenifigens]
MIEDRLTSITDERLLVALKEVNPPIEKLMADRFELRQEMRRKQAELDAERQRVKEMHFLTFEEIPQSLAFAKRTVLLIASLSLFALIIAYFSKIFEIKTISIIFISLLLPIWLIDRAEGKFGRISLFRFWSKK